MKRIVKFARLPAHEKVLFVQALRLLIEWRLQLALQDFEATIRKNNKASTRSFAGRTTHVSPERISALLDSAGKIVPFTTCLSKALTGQILFFSYGHKTKLHIGVGKGDNGSFKAHAWLTFDDKIITGYVDDIGNYRELPPLPDM